MRLAPSNNTTVWSRSVQLLVPLNWLLESTTCVSPKWKRVLLDLFSPARVELKQHDDLEGPRGKRQSEKATSATMRPSLALFETRIVAEIDANTGRAVETSVEILAK